jgi:hypothetical protein
MEQEKFVGFDVSQAETSVCVVDGTGKVLWQGKCTSTRLCCTGQQRLRSGPLPFLLREAYVLWTPELQHPVQRIDGNRDLARSALIGARS